jgi:hypothetical protein
LAQRVDSYHAWGPGFNPQYWKKKKKEESWRAQEGETPPQKSLVLKEDGQVVLSGPKGRTEKPSGTQEAST